MLTLENYTTIVTDPLVWRSLTNTVIIGGAAAIFTVLLCSLVAYITTRTKFAGRNALDLICWLPNAIPGIVAGVGMLWAYIMLPVALFGTLTLLVIVFITIGLPVGVRLMSGVMGQLSPELEECSMVHGASWGQTLQKNCSTAAQARAGGWNTNPLRQFFPRCKHDNSFLRPRHRAARGYAIQIQSSRHPAGLGLGARGVLTVINVTAMLVARRLGAFGQQS